MRKIENLDDVHFMVDEFYKRVRQHEELGPIFNNKIGELWVLHIDTLTRFWETLLLGNRTYFGSPFPKHMELPIEDVHFDMWLGLFKETIDDLFEGDKAEEAKNRASLIAKTFQSKLNYLKQQST